MTELEILQKMLPMMVSWKELHLDNTNKQNAKVIGFAGYCYFYVEMGNTLSLVGKGLHHKLPNLWEVSKEHPRFYGRFGTLGSYWFNINGCPVEKPYVKKFYDIRIVVLEETIERLTSFKNE